MITEMSKPSALKPFILLISMFILQQACGSFAVIFYAVNVFQVMFKSENSIVKRGRTK